MERNEEVHSHAHRAALFRPAPAAHHNGPAPIDGRRVELEPAVLVGARLVDARGCQLEQPADVAGSTKCQVGRLTGVSSVEAGERADVALHEGRLTRELAQPVDPLDDRRVGREHR